MMWWFIEVDKDVEAIKEVQGSKKRKRKGKGVER